VSEPSALGRWRTQLGARAIPPPILAAAPEPPWGFPAVLFRTRAARAGAGGESPTTARARAALPEGGVVLDVGCGGGATSLPLADRAGTLVGVDVQPDMPEVFKTAGEARGVVAETLLGTWPEVAEQAPVADVVVCGHVLYNVPLLEPFVTTLSAHATRRVVLELTETHPLVWMHDLWRRFHGVSFPDGPTADDAEDALVELGVAVRRDERPASDGTERSGFDRREDAVALVRRRLCLPASRDDEVAEALGERLQRDDGLWSAGPVPGQRVVTLWWDTGGPPVPA